LYVIGLKYLELLPAPSAEAHEGESAEHAAPAAEGGHT